MTSLIQPMDQEILQFVKRGYKKRLLEKVLREEKNKNNEPLTIPQKMKSVNMKLVIDWVAESWDEVSQNALRKSWKQVWPDLQFLDEKKKIECRQFRYTDATCSKNTRVRNIRCRRFG